jgi:4-amino-4-deoxy-L-arabinose transferase-like glycosyltransferase
MSARADRLPAMIAEAFSRVALSAIRTRARARSPRTAVGQWVGKARTIPRPLAALLAMATIQVTAWILVLPPFQGPDEEGHFAYVQHLAETGAPPDRYGGSGRSYSTEQAEAIGWANLLVLRGILGARPGWTEAEEARWHELEASHPDAASSDGDGPNATGQNPPLYYALETIPYHLSPGGSFFNRYYMARFGSAIFYVAAVAFMWLIASELFRPLWARTLATAIFGLHPKLAMLGALINPDTLLVLIWTAFIYVGLRIVRHGPTLRRLIGAGAAVVASVLTHGRGLAIVPALAVLLGIAYFRWRPPVRQTLLVGAIGLGIATVGLAVAGVFTSGLSGEGAAYGGLLGWQDDRSFNIRQFLSYVWQFYLPKLEFMQASIGVPGYGFREVYIQSFYSDLASLEIQYPRFAIDLLHVATMLLLVGLYTVVVARLNVVKRSWPTIAFLLVTGLSMVTLLHLSSYTAMLADPGDPLLTGRYLFPLLPLLAIGVTVVVTALPRRIGAFAAGALVAMGIVLQLSGLGLAFVRFYA